MITSEQAYIKFLQKVNKNLTNDNIAVDRGRFVLIYNETQNKFVEWVLEKRNEDDIRDIHQLLVKDSKLDKDRFLLNHQDFKLPEDYMSFVNIQVFGGVEGCKGNKIGVTEVKSENVEELLLDENNKPSFKFRDTFYTLAGEKVNVYTDNFEVDNCYLTYYRYPRPIDIKGYIKTDNTASRDINPELEDRIVDRILSAASKEFNINNDNLQRVQFDKDRIFSEI